MGRKTIWVTLAAVLGLVVWATVPPQGVALGRSCGPASLRARVSRLIYGDAFWRAQLLALTSERDRLLIRMSQPEDEENNPVVEGRMMRLAEGGADAAERQRQADAARQRRQERVNWLIACQQDVERRLQQ